MIPTSQHILPSWWSRDLETVKNLLIQNINERFLDTFAQNLFKAISDTEKQHAGQLRKGGGLFAVHPLRVCLSLIVELGVLNIDFLTAALLHDTLEDTESTEESLLSKYSPRVVNVILKVTRPGDGKRPAGGDSITDDYFRTIIEAGSNVIILKIADKIDNLRDALFHPVEAKRALYVAEANRVFIPLCNHISDAACQSRLLALLNDAIRNHSLLSQDTAHEKPETFQDRH